MEQSSTASTLPKRLETFWTSMIGAIAAVSRKNREQGRELPQRLHV
jgi:hypothetical protein